MAVTSWRLQCLDAQVAELDEGGGGTPCLVLCVVATVVLQDDGAFRPDARHLRLVNHGLAVQDHGHGLALHRNFHLVPFAYGFVGVHLWKGSLADGGILAPVKCPQLTRSAWPAPQVQLRLSRTAHEDARVSVLDWFVSYDVADGVEQLGVVGRSRGSLEAPVEAQDVVAETFLGGQVAPLGPASSIKLTQERSLGAGTTRGMPPSLIHAVSIPR